MLLGAVTAVGGGVVRDIVLRRVPGILGGNTLYATAALAGAGSLVLVTEAGYPTAGSIIGLIVGAGLCLVARWRGWILPSADAWSPTSVVPVRLRGRLNRRVTPRLRGHGGPATEDPRKAGHQPSQDPTKPSEQS